MAELLQREWKIAKSTRTCVACTGAILPSDAGTACLYEAPAPEGEKEAAGYVRKDFCAACAAKGLEPPLARWTFKPSPPPEKPFRADLDALREFYAHLAGKEGVPDRILRYLLALYLVRKRRLRLERTDRGPEGETLWVSPAKGAEPEAVAVPNFAAEDLEAARAQLDSLLGIQVKPSAQTPTAAPAADVQPV